MKKLINILFIASLSTSLFAKTINEEAIGSYAVIFGVHFKNSLSYMNSNIKVNSNLCLDSNINNTFCENDEKDYHLHTEANYSNNIKDIKTDTSYISTNTKYCNIRLGSYGSNNSGSYYYDIEGYITKKYEGISILPMSKLIATGKIEGYYKESSGSYYRIIFMADYYLEIRPKEIKCRTSDERKLLYNDTICIKATKGFPKEVYQWRYSYKNAQGVPIKGTFTAFKTENNGATIYVKGSDFLSESAFHDLVYREEAISIIPDGAEEYNKPLSVEGVNLTAKPSAPNITKVTPSMTSMPMV